MNSLTIGQTVLSKEHGEGKIESTAKEHNGYRTYNIEWSSGILTHPAHEAENFSYAHAIKCFPQKEGVGL